MGDELQIFFRLGLGGWGIALLATLFIGLSAYVRIVTILGIVRLGLGWSSLPGSFITAALALSLSFFVMAPTLREASVAAERGMKEGGSSEQQQFRAFQSALEVWRGYLSANSPAGLREQFVESAKKLRPEESAPANDSFRVAAPAFVVWQLQSAFVVGLRLFFPLLLIDLLVIGALLSLSAEQVSPQLIALPLKILLFVAVDGWSLISLQLIQSSGGG